MANIFSMDTPFARFMNVLAGVLWVGILWLICSIPVITIPAASMAAYHTAARVIRKGRGYMTKTFIKQFWSYLRRWIVVSILDLLVLAWLLFDVIYLFHYGTELSMALSYILYGIMALYLSVNLMLAVCGSRFGGSRLEIFKLSLYIIFRHFLTMLGMLVLTGLCAYLVYIMPWSILVFPGVFWFVSTFLMERVLRQYMKGTTELFGAVIGGEMEEDEKEKSLRTWIEQRKQEKSSKHGK